MKRLVYSLLVAACGDSEPALPPAELDLVPVATGLASPVYLTAPPGDARLFIVEQPGRVRIVKTGTLVPTAFLDIEDDVLYGGEQGLLSIAFHPEYAQNGFFYVNYTDNAGDSRVARYTVSADADVADPASAKAIITIPHPTHENHNGGHVLFGPDGMLYIPTGDGGSGGDPDNNAQNPNQLLGKLLRIDVDGGDPYAIPPDNPYAGTTDGRRKEIWALGLRNPWRVSFDLGAGLLYTADVGQDAWEEINAVPLGVAGLNYGWRVMEGAVCFNPSPCNQAGLVLPRLVYSHAAGCSITGGHVYRGSAQPALVGHYFYADYCSGWIRGFRLVGGVAIDQRTWVAGGIGNISSFGQDAAGELYVVSHGGTVYRIEQQ